MSSSWQRWKGIMKAQPFEEKRLNKWQPPFIVQPKYDGIRCRAVPIPSGGHLLLSSEENPIYLPHIQDAIRTQKQFDGLELDGEIYRHGWPFEQIFSVASRTVNPHPDAPKLQFHIFDIVNDDPQGLRSVQISQFELHDKVGPIQFSPFWLCADLQAIMEVYNELISYGYEGIIVRNINAPYERKRSLWVMKFKPKQEDTYRIVGYEEELSINGSPKGQLGSLRCVGEDGAEFSVGSGFSQRDRRALWDRREDLAGKVCRVSYQHITSGKGVPRFPIFVEVLK